MLVEQTDDLGKVGGMAGLRRLLNHCLICFLALVFPHTGIDVMVAEMEHAEAELGLFLRYLRCDPGPPRGELGFPAINGLVVLGVDQVAERLRLIAVVFKKRAYGVVSGDLDEVNYGRSDERLVDVAPVTHLADIALRLLQNG